jgi:hypothetical protein
LYIPQHHKWDPKPLINIVTPAGNIPAFWQYFNAFRVANKDILASKGTDPLFGH